MRRFTPAAAFTFAALFAIPASASAHTDTMPTPAPPKPNPSTPSPKPAATMPMPTADHGPRSARTAMTVAASATKDALSGWNLHVRTTGFRWTPAEASTKARPGGGHAHVYVDGVKLSRLYGPWLHIPALSPGEHEITVELNGNDHRAWQWKGKAVSTKIRVTEPKPMASMPTMHPHPAIPSEQALAVQVSVKADAMAGWNVFVRTDAFKLEPWAANTAPKQGTGHMHLLVDGVKVARLYTRATHLATPLEPGPHTVTVSLNANEHSPWSWNGAEVSASRTFTVPEAA